MELPEGTHSSWERIFLDRRRVRAAVSASLLGHHACVPICNVAGQAAPTASTLFQTIPSTRLISNIYMEHCCNTMFSGHRKEHLFLYDPNGAFLKDVIIAAHPAFVSMRGLRNLSLASIHMAFPN